ncbi:hypothetical protein EVAR_2363_1 [Eumeta japonica]|uniref:Uncharacterized protein n=1 Tax=Eumeta variegata TaxID=151549 RepID=A0A4C1SGA0_EUMVA|nr:hypothetical protein EVAR_2363_1 [Eumeta japonica]
MDVLIYYETKKANYLLFKAKDLTDPCAGAYNVFDMYEYSISIRRRRYLIYSTVKILPNNCFFFTLHFGSNSTIHPSLIDPCAILSREGTYGLRRPKRVARRARPRPLTNGRRYNWNDCLKI